MTYQETLSHIYGLARFGMKPGLTRIAALLTAAEKHDAAIANLEQQWQAYLRRLPPQ